METNEQMNVEQTAEVKEEPKEPAKAKEPQTRTYTDAEVDEIINKRFAKWQKEQDRKVEEAKRLEQMNAEEKAKYELGELQKELEKSPLWSYCCLIRAAFNEPNDIQRAHISEALPTEIAIKFVLDMHYDMLFNSIDRFNDSMLEFPHR